MLSRILASHSRTQLRLLSLTLSPHLHSHPPCSQIPKLPLFPPHDHRRHFSTNNKDGNDEKPVSDFWKISQQSDDLDDIFRSPDEQLGGDRKIEALESEKPAAWVLREDEGGVNELLTEMDDVAETEAKSYDKSKEDEEETKMIQAAQRLQLENEQQSLFDVIQGPNRAFGDLIAASGITDAMLDSLIALKNFQDIEGLPPLAQIEDERYENTLKKSSRHELELQKQEDAAKARVRKVDEKGRAYGTGKRKCSIARVWIQPGEGKFCINDKEFDVYFPMLDHRAALLRPFSETKTLGLWDVRCTVKGGGTTGQVDAIRLGVSRALQNWEPGLRPPLREAGFLTRDPRIVERKKPGKAKARKSFQWVKR